MTISFSSNDNDEFQNDNVAPYPNIFSSDHKTNEKNPLIRNRLPETRDSLTHKFSIDGVEGYVTVGMYENGYPGEVFIKMSKQGTTLDGMMDSFAILLSLSLQSGMDLSNLCYKFKHTKFAPMGSTSNAQIPIVSSIIDYIFRWLEITFI